jgi:hypothetical protein
MATFEVYRRYGNAHNVCVGQVKAENAKKAFIIAVQKYFEEKHYNKYTEFIVSTTDKGLEDYDKSYGYDYYGQRASARGFRSSAKWIIDRALANCG